MKLFELLLRILRLQAIYMNERLFHTELKQYFGLLTDGFAPVDETGWSLLVEEVESAYATLPHEESGQRVRFSKVQREEVAFDGLWEQDAAPCTKTEEPDIAALAGEVEAKIAELVAGGFPVETIEGWLQKAVRLSRVLVTADWLILLPDYGKEIRMQQLPKTLFLFFLRHPEGCRLKELYAHREELLAIYRKLTISDDQAQVEASIDALVNPQGNSFSEKCAAVKLAFLKEIPERIAKNYYIQGPQGGVKGIGLDRSLVEWEAEL